MNLLRSLIRNLLNPSGGIFAMLQTLLAQGLTMAVNIGTGIITARLLGPIGRGEFAAVSLWLILPSMLASAGIQNGIVYLAGKQPEHASSITLAGMMTASLVFIPVSLTCFCLAPWLMHGYSPAIVGLAQTIMLLSIVNVWAITGRQGLLAVKNYRAYNLNSYGTSSVYLALLVGLVVLHHVTPTSANIAQFLGTALVLLVTLFQLMRHWHWRTLRPFARLRELLRFAMTSASIDIVSVLNGLSDRVILVGLISVREFGIYAVAVSFSRILFVVQSAVSSVMLTNLTGKPREEIELFVHRTFRVLLWMLALLCCLVFLFDSRLLGLVYGPAFRQATPVFRILIVEGAVTCISQMLIQPYLASNKARLPSMMQVGTYTLAATGMICLAPLYGAVGAAAALATASTLRMLLLLGNLHRIGLRIPSPIPTMSDFDPILDQLRARRDRVRVREAEAGIAK